MISINLNIEFFVTFYCVYYKFFSLFIHQNQSTLNFLNNEIIECITNRTNKRVLQSRVDVY